MPGTPRPHVVIIGGGFGGLAAAKALAKAPVDVTIIDRRNHHLFQPLLYQVATAGLSPAEIAAPIRSIVKRQANTRVLLAEVVGIDREGRRVRVSGSADVYFDYLILATGARHSYFGNDDWAPHAPGIKSIEDATAVRRKVLLALEQAESETDLVRRKALLTFVVIGGGPTGIEMAGAIAELARLSVSMEFRHITPHCSRVVLVEAGDRLLPSFPPALSETARRSLEELGVEVMLRAPVKTIDARGLIAGDRHIDAATVVWAAGVKASPAAEWLGAKADRAGRVVVDAELHPPGDNRIFVIGDTAACAGPDGRMLPGVAPVAKQQGKFAANAIIADLARRPLPPFAYRDFGSLATIGRRRAVIDFGRMTMSGFPAWLVWCVAHIYFLVGFRNRFAVGLSWLWNYLTFQRSARLITGDIQHEQLEEAPSWPARTRAMN